MKARSQSSSTPKKRSSRKRTAKSAGVWTRDAVLRELKSVADPKVRAKMAYFGVQVPHAHGISAPILHSFAKHIGRNHELAKKLWSSGVHEAKILATLISEPAKVTSAEMDRWARSFNAWDVVDACCCYLYAYASPAWSKLEAWSCRKEEFVKRAAFSLAAYLAYKDKTSPDTRFEDFLRVIEREAHDDRNFVRKAVNWALRNIGKRNWRLNRAAIAAAEKIRQQDSRAARWIAADALRELKSEAVQKRLREKRGYGMKNTQSAAMKIRRARKNDVARLAELAGELGYPTTSAEMKVRFAQVASADRHCVFVAEQSGGEVVGWLHVSVAPLLDVPQRAEINGLIVSEQLRSRGAGALLMQAAETWSRKKKCVNMSVRSNVIRGRAHKFYERQGYVHYKTQKAFRKPL